MGLMDQFNESLDYKKTLQWVEDQGGINSLLDKFRQNGLSDKVSSWIGSGENSPISADTIQQVLSSEALQSLASRLGVDVSKASGLLAEYLPKVVDLLSPKGETPKDGNLLTMGWELIKGKLFG
ncbi:YidB family protein [Zymobacter palmae]|nr:YidB family protein [Zymobacter palmae]